MTDTFGTPGAPTPIDDGGPASNMTVRDEFAKAAMKSMLQNSDLLTVVGNHALWQDESSLGVVARGAYRQADAMLRERANG